MAGTMPKPAVAVISIGQMGIGIASLLRQHLYPVITSLEGRIRVSDVILSIVPPKDVMAMARAVADASRRCEDENLEKRVAYLELNAISPHLARSIGKIIEGANMNFLDGGILGFPPKQLDNGTWFRPAVVTSRPPLAVVFQHLSQDLISTLNIRHISDTIGSASGLKMCFGAIYKGHAAIAFQAYTTASNLGILLALQDHLKEFFSEVAERVESSMLVSQQKAYRWIKEMEEISETFAEEGNWGRDIFRGVADVFRAVGRESKDATQSSIDTLVDNISAAQRRRKYRI